MSTRTCPEGHLTTAVDWCDICGSPMAGGPADPSSNGAQMGAPPQPPTPRATPGAPPPPAPQPPTPSSTRPCPSCGSEGPDDALFCEVCGYDFTTGVLPPDPDPAPADPLSIDVPPARAPATGPAAFVAEVWVDPEWYEVQESDDPCPSAGAPVVVPLRERSVLVGRTSVSRSIHPEIDCSSDTGVSRRHCQLTTDGQRWWVEDLQSANGTYVGSAGAGPPSDAITPGQRRELADDERVYVGAWTRIVVRPATPDEQHS